MLGAEDAHLELAHRNKAVIVPVREVYKMYCGTFLTGLTVFADAGVLQQHLKQMLVVFE